MYHGSDDAWLFVGHGTDATVRSFGINAGGSIAAPGFSFDVGLQGTLGDLAVMPGLLFVTDESTATDGITGVYSFDINATGVSRASPARSRQPPRLWTIHLAK